MPSTTVSHHLIELRANPGVAVLARVVLWNPQVFIWETCGDVPQRQNDSPDSVRTFLLTPPPNSSDTEQLWQRLVNSARGDRDTVELVNGDRLDGRVLSIDTTHVVLAAEFFRDSIFVPRVRVAGVALSRR
ncbi:MAG: hypothetical protein ACRC46_02505 [Thermoguttaceae bacterium]